MENNNLIPFPCTACGKCCREIYRIEEAAFLNRGDGVCRHLDETTNLCQIYDNRPLFCQVEKYYQTFLQDKFSWKDFIQINVEICHKLQNCSK